MPFRATKSAKPQPDAAVQALSHAQFQLYFPAPTGLASPGMFKKFLVLSLPLLLAGCASNFTNLTPTRQARNADNLYPVEVQFNSRQQTLRWHTINPYVLVGGERLPMRPTPLMKNRWEGLVPLPAGASKVDYRYKFEFESTTFGGFENDSALSPKYELKVLEAK